MGAAVERQRPADIEARHTALTVEIIGPAGAGKSTLAKALAACSDHIVMRDPPYYRRITSIPFFTINTLLLLPLILHLWLSDPGYPSLYDVAQMVILRGWARTLRRGQPGTQAVGILDEGPIHMLAFLWLFGPPSLRAVQRWWSEMYERWARALDMVIWLDAPNSVLVERIRARNEWNSVKWRSDPDAARFLDEYRTVYEDVVTALAARGRNLRVIRLDTSQESRDKVCAQVLDAIDHVRTGERWP